MRRRSVVLLSAASAAIVAGIIGCGSDYTRPSGTIPAIVADGKPCAAPNNIPVATSPPGTDPAGSALPVGTVDKPDPSLPVGTVPGTELGIRDITVGTGAEVKDGDTVTANYIGVSCSSGKQFDSSYDRGEPAEFSLSGVIEGWKKGLVGMKEGGRRHLVIPPGLAYGDKPTSPDILPGETLVFIVDLVKATTPPPTTTTTAPPATTPPGSEVPGTTKVPEAGNPSTTAPPTSAGR
jgi:peptidylprolyl isomerase